MSTRSHEVIKQAITKHGVKKIASEMHLSTSLLYKWCQPKEEATESGADNPLDRLVNLVELTGDTGPVEWLCEQTGGFYVPNIQAGKSVDSAIIKNSQAMLKEFSDLLEAVSNSAADGTIDDEESEHIRSEWEDLKSITEAFVSACERGDFTKGPKSQTTK
jgi:hypothetical protein